MQQNYPLEILRGQRDFCLNNLISAWDQMEGATKGTEKYEKGSKQMLQTLIILDEIETLIEETGRVTEQD